MDFAEDCQISEIMKLMHADLKRALRKGVVKDLDANIVC